MSTGFIIAAALLLAVVLAILITPLWRPPKMSDVADQRAVNLAIFRDQLGELERERQEGSLAEIDFAQSRSELQRRLLDEVSPTTIASGSARGARQTALALLALIPLAAVLGYALLGNPRALDPAQRQARQAPQQIEAMVAGLVEKLRQNPDDSKGWIMLARSYKVLEKFPEAAQAYGRVGSLLQQDAGLLADYAEVLSQVAGGNLQGKPVELIERALKIDPHEPQALLLAGAAARDRREYALAAEYWTRLLVQLEPGSPETEALSTAISQAQERAGLNTSQQANNANDGFAVSGEVALSGKLAGQAKPGDILFVFARAEGGPRMPLAATRATVADLPLRFRFDDSMALAGGRKLSEFASVSIEARIAKAGEPRSSRGDLFGTLAHVKPGSQNLRLLIDQVQP